jgi:hypothetical protein
MANIIRRNERESRDVALRGRVKPNPGTAAASSIRSGSWGS